MPGLETRQARTFQEHLFLEFSEDLKDLKDWRSNYDFLHGKRLGQRTGRRNLYPGAPNFCDPIIDDNVRKVTSTEIQILLDATQFVNFIPLSVESNDLKREAELAFNTFLRVLPGFRKKVETLLDRSNETGFLSVSF